MATPKMKKKPIWIDIQTGNSFLLDNDRNTITRCEKDGRPHIVFQENVTGVSSLSRTFEFTPSRTPSRLKSR